MAGDSESRFGVLAGFVACVLVLALTVMAFAPGVAPSVFEMSLKPVSLDLPDLPLPTETPSFALDETV
ncbi:hypothetical protein [Vitreimonas flagellata]|uniref:hypothetical protein n=1 Tax=Vitreimonas flagellata TaxID=2560861 RepID=UPI0010752D1E|nr:hypothetical protein [Vitreimonas flagellata]